MKQATKRSRRLSIDAPLAVVGYARVSTVEQADSGLGLEAQRAAIQAEVSRRGWQLVAIYEDAGFSGAKTENRPQYAAALTALDAGKADAIVVSRIDRLSRSGLELARLLDRSKREGWQLVDLTMGGIDTTTPAGKMMASTMGNMAEYEREMGSQRTRAAMAALKQQGKRLGRPRELPASLVERIVQEHEQGSTQVAIANRLNEERVPTAQGGVRWYQATVRAVLRSAAIDRTTEAIRARSAA